MREMAHQNVDFLGFNLLFHLGLLTLMAHSIGLEITFSHEDSSVD